MEERGELILSIFAAIAQEESNSISQNILWANERRNADGKRYFSGILAVCGVVFNGAYVDCSGGVVWTHCEA